MVISSCNWCTPYSHKRTCTVISGFGNKRTSGDDPNNSIVEINLNIRSVQETWGDLLSLRFQWKNHQLPLVWKTLKLVKKNYDDPSHPNYSLFDIGQNTEKSPGDLGRLAVTKIPVENHQLTLTWKTLKWLK